MQACAESDHAATLEREVRALTEAMSERKVTTSTIVTLFDERTIRDGSKTIRVAPAWRWMLEGL